MTTDGKALDLKDLVAKVRDDLQAAMVAGKDKDIKFELETIELELRVVAKQTGEGKAGVKFWIADANVSGKIENEHAQTIKLKLVPQRIFEALADNGRAAKSNIRGSGNRHVLISRTMKKRPT